MRPFITDSPTPTHPSHPHPLPAAAVDAWSSSYAAPFNSTTFEVEWDGTPLAPTVVPMLATVGRRRLTLG